MLRDGETCEVINVSEAVLEEIARVLTRNWTRYERQLEELERAKRRKIAKTIMDYIDYDYYNFSTLISTAQCAGRVV
jgi:rubrerythrin